MDTFINLKMYKLKSFKAFNYQVTEIIYFVKYNPSTR
jgi:hypothetical protein